MTEIGKMNERVDIITIASTKADNGRPIASEISRETRWAKVEDRQGVMVYDKAQIQFIYDYKITFRHYPSNALINTNILEYKGQKLSIKSIQIKSEGSRRFEVVRCSKLE